MNILYLRESDSLYIELQPREAATAWEVTPGVLINYDAEGEVVGVEINEASRRANLDGLKVGNFPGPVESIDRPPPTH
jgi:uncharacterized protein YuzE